MKSDVPPWHELKLIEMRALDLRSAGTLRADLINQLRTLFGQCKSAPDASKAICYHGALALILEFDGDLGAALQHRAIEMGVTGIPARAQATV